MNACLTVTAPGGMVNATATVGNVASDVTGFDAARFQLRPACRSSLLAMLDYVFDGVFWADIAATFVTGVPYERSTAVKCVRACMYACVRRMYARACVGDCVCVC